MGTRAKVVVAIILLLAGVLACVFAAQRYIAYQDRLALSVNEGYEADRFRGQSQRALDLRRESDRQHDVAAKTFNQAALVGLLGVGLIGTSVVLLVRRRGNSTNMSAQCDKAS